VQTLPAPADRHLGSYDALLAGARASQVERLNRAIRERCADGRGLLFDVAWLAATFGLGEWHDDAAWHLAKQPFAHAALPAYGESLARLLGAIRGKSRKALVLDLDNTVWSGVIGDDGIDGINLAQGDATGEAHLALQRYALELRERGVVLAVSSKNEDEVARAVFRDHPDMLLREAHIAVFQANWNDKASNLKAIAEMLNIGTDALVFVDDNPAERAQVRRALPEVAVPEMPDNPAGYVRTLAAAGYFEAAGFSPEDRERARMYGENAKRAALQVSAGGIEDYLRSLAMTIRFAPFDAAGRARIAQLINKSNQFNLTTRRYSEAEVAALADDPGVTTLQVRLADTFGDNGMISVVICRAEGRDWTIDTWLMSCRVLGRRVEQAVLAQLHRLAAARGVERLVGIYRPSGRNQIVARHYADLGFALEREEADGTQVWTLPVDKTGADPTAGLFAATIAEGYGAGDAVS
jgi:FkbH-like protein